MVAPSVETIPVKHCNFEAKVKTSGSGPPLLYLHAAGGPIWDPFVEGLCERFTVYAPHHPGTGETARDSIYAVENIWDLLLIYEEMLDALGVQSLPVVGTSFGGMMAFELAAHQPDRISKIVALDPIGLWRDDAPVAPYMLLPPEKLVAILYKHLDSPPVQAALAMPRRSPTGRRDYRRSGLGARRHRKIRLADSRQGVEETPASGRRRRR